MKFNYSLKKENLKIFNSNDDDEIKVIKESLSLNLFENYVNSYEFLYDVFCQIEFLKTLLFDKNIYLNFNDLSKLYISINSKDRGKYLEEFKKKCFSYDKKEVTNNIFKNNLIKKDYVIEENLKMKIFEIFKN